MDGKEFQNRAENQHKALKIDISIDIHLRTPTAAADRKGLSINYINNF